MQQPRVSVKIVTYNHEAYIAQCLAGVVAQKTTFPFEVIIGEDCSTDGTRAIVQSYANEYPDLIRVISSENNVGPARNLARIRAACSGEYEALCEGDDCWIDPQKLQRQVDFLDAQPDYTLCFHDALRYFEDKRGRPIYYCPLDLPETPTIADVIQRPVFIPTASILARRTFLESLPEWRTQFVCSDLVVRLWSAHVGKIGYLNHIMSLKRQHSTGLTATTGRKRMADEALKVYKKFDEVTDYQYTDLIQQRIAFDKQYQRLGSLFYLLHPKQAIERWHREQRGAGI